MHLGPERHSEFPGDHIRPPCPVLVSRRLFKPNNKVAAMTVNVAHAPQVLRELTIAALILFSIPAFADIDPESFPSDLRAMEWREIGPFRGGRSAAVTGIPGDRDTYYFGATGGGVWKTINGGTDWENVSDGYFGGSIGAVAVSEWDPNVIYVGTGEKTVRGNVF